MGKSGIKANGKIFQEAQERMGKSTVEIAEEMGESEDVVVKWIRGERKLSFDSFIRLSQCLHLNPDDFNSPSSG